jgi:hypothetical protein
MKLPEEIEWESDNGNLPTAWLTEDYVVDLAVHLRVWRVTRDHRGAHTWRNKEGGLVAFLEPPTYTDVSAHRAHKMTRSQILDVVMPILVTQEIEK